MEYHGFGAEITFNHKEGRFDGAVVGASSDVAFIGKSVTELERNFKEVVDKHLAKCASKHVDPYRKFNGTIITRVEPEIHRDAYLAASRDGKSLNKWCELAIREKLSRSKSR
jgi:predicted HicB family RNase H-like nuclease